MSVRVEIETDSGTYRLTFLDHESVHLYEGERWSDYECDCHCPGCGAERLEHGCFACACGSELDGLFERCPDCHREDCDS